MVNKKIIRGPLLLYLLFLSLSVSRIPIIILYPNLSNPKLSISLCTRQYQTPPYFSHTQLEKVFLFLCPIALFSWRRGFGFSPGLFWFSISWVEDEEEGSGSISFALFVDCLEVFLCGFLDLVWLSWFLVGGCLWVPGFLMAIDECVCGGGW
jgi:hypothetical protein